MNVSLPESLKDFVDEQVMRGGYGVSSESIGELIRKDADRLQLQGLLLEGGASASAGPAGRGYFSSLRKRLRLGPTPAS